MLEQKCFLTGIGEPWVKVTRDILPSGAQGFRVHSTICGTYFVNQDLCGPEDWSPQMISLLQTKYSNRLHVLAGLALRRSDNESPVEFRREKMENLIRAISLPSGPLEQIDLLLKYLYGLYMKGFSPEKYFEIYQHPDLLDLKYPITFSRNPNEFSWLVIKALEFGYVESETESIKSKKGPPPKIRLSIKGFERIQSLQKSEDSRQVFVAMSFGLDEKEPGVYQDGIRKALKVAGYEPMFLNEESHNDKIDDKIIVEIRRSRFVVVDVTEDRPNVYFEAGFALGEGIPVIWTCQENKWKEEEAHFDTRQYNFLLWNTPEDLFEKLSYRIEATLGFLPGSSSENEE